MSTAPRTRTTWRDGAFFGIHYDLHAVATDTELGAALTHEHLAAELRRLAPDWVQCDAKGHPGWTSYPTAIGSPSPGIVRDALRIHREVTSELGLPLAIHYSGLMDSRAIELHPDWAVVEADGSTHDMKICPRSDYRAGLMIPQLVELAVDRGVDGIWVDGENWGAAPCWCERCRDGFGDEVPVDASHPRWHDWLAYHRAAVVEHVRSYCDAVHRAAPACAVTSNWLASVIQPDDVLPDLDWLSGDSAPGVPTVLNARVLDGRGLPWELMTWSFITPKPGHPIVDAKSPAHLRQEVAVSMVLGGGVVLYDITERSGHIVGWRQQRLADLGLWVRERREVVQGTTSVPQVGVVQSDRHHYLHSEPLFTAGDGDAPLRGAVSTLLETHASVDVLSEAELERVGHRYPLLVLPEQEDLSPAALEALTRYVEGGGLLVVTGSRIAEVAPELVGAKPIGAVLEAPVLLRVGDEAAFVAGPWQPVEPTEARAVSHLLASREPEDAGEDVAVTVRDLGAGRVVAAHGALFDHQAEHHTPPARALVAELVGLTGASLDVELLAPARVHVALREKDGDRIVHLVNMGGSHPLAAVTTHVDEVPPTGPMTLRVRTPSPPTDVETVPASRVAWSTEGEWTTVEITDVDIHLAIVLRGGGGR